MKWFDRWFYKKAKWAWENKHEMEQDIYPISKASLVVEESADWGDGLRINVKRVNGGHIVSFRVYDRKTDRSDDRHYIITSESDFNNELGKLITLESMKQS